MYSHIIIQVSAMQNIEPCSWLQILSILSHLSSLPLVSSLFDSGDICSTVL